MSQQSARRIQIDASENGSEEEEDPAAADADE